jgi:hypothetical protein
MNERTKTVILVLLLVASVGLLVVATRTWGRLSF